MRSFLCFVLCSFLLGACSPFGRPSGRPASPQRPQRAVVEEPLAWTLETTQDWTAGAAETEHLRLSEGRAVPTASPARFRSVLKRYGRKRRAKRITVEQSPLWTDWKPVTGVEPAGGGDAPVFLPVATDDYWYLNAEESGGPYGAWHSTDMNTWTHYPGVVGTDWVTTAEYARGTFYVYYDNPNDQDPHLVVDTNLTDTAHREVGEVFADPSHGSDSGVLRGEDGSFHLIYEDWSPIHAPRHEWDSPLAGHTRSPDGIRGFRPHEFPPPIDDRTTPLPAFATYDHSSGDSLLYHKHRGPQNAYGDFTLVQVGDRYYLFCDYNPHDGPMRVGVWTSDSLGTSFEWGGEIGKGFHPDPTIGFAEGKFYLFVQRADHDYVSSGPWTGRVEARVGVDEDGDGTVDQWTSWSLVEESYSRRPGFARVVKKAPATLDLSALPPGYGFRFELRMRGANESGTDVRFRTEDRAASRYATDSVSRPILDGVRVSFE